MKHYFFLLSFACTLLSWAQNTASVRGSLYALPNLQYSPETSLGLGAALFYSKRWQNNPNNRTSIQKFYPLYTLKKQFSVGGSTDNWFDNNRTHLYFYAKYSYFPNEFYSYDSDEKKPYVSRFFEIESFFEKQVYPDLYLGIRADFRAEKIVEDGSLLSGYTTIDPYRVTGVGPRISYDSRDNTYYPHKGFFITATLKHFSKYLGNIGSFTRFDWDFRQYIPIKNHHILAYNLLYSWTDGQRLPFQLLPFVGGSYLHRGYFQGRYRGTQLYAVQVDYRFPVSSRLKAVIFTSVAGTSLSDTLLRQKPHAAAGVGLRYRLGNDGFHIRLDLALGQSLYPYIDVLEAF